MTFDAGYWTFNSGCRILDKWIQGFLDMKRNLQSKLLQPDDTKNLISLHPSRRIMSKLSVANYQIPDIYHPVSSIEKPATSNPHPASSIQYPASGIQHRASSIQPPASSVPPPASDLCQRISHLGNGLFVAIYGARQRVGFQPGYRL